MGDFVNTWQSLIGAALGPFLAVILSALGFWLKSIFETKKERKEFLRRIEIGITRSFDDTFKTRMKLQYFASRLRQLIADIQKITDEKHFSLETINYPTIKDIYRDIEAPNFKVRSYYLHNKLLWADSGIKETNETVISFKHDFSELQRKNEMLVILMMQNQSPNPTQQRGVYIENLSSFANAIDEFIKKFMGQGIEIMTQIKIYNEYLRKKHGYWFLWKHEGTRFKYFQNKIDQKKFSRNLDSLEKIDKAIQKEVDNAIRNADVRASKLQL
ncbi:MAG: hypothetical protein COU32_00665 [Candidatus Magasanikbacteria bacterium CG10_big_fil_rev_8_21_14_0_10_42_10]|uniref:Uncharacterized protein n=2 Tax=Candidatus Magasanikiibacteriota TaxID=1752731 RepID=A0A2H0TX09_9BACT|nr:MAG: hypothetical protein COU32_00665 [Candidatus Magasanikbacteria bacterium CG10_big_fil_rev_8_21_14_0_10_42_10]PIZ94615.1 MAG: hypothetical protein COX82_00360 [Candidatus Magasanikbacteria bacterium CG_4_10_14_0_2_um_filter_41_10]